jgi:2-haloacid dehalogenase
MDFSRFATISFDCYGTLIDWEAGILPVLRTLLGNHGLSQPDAVILQLYSEFEARAETAPYRPYREVLQSVVRGFANHFKFQATSSEIHSLHESVPGWLPFPDTMPALLQLQKDYKLAVISNIDDNLFAETQKLLGIDFHEVVTAQQAGSYKPSTNNFEIALHRLAISSKDLLHAAQSIYHDVVPARSLGIATVWVNRKSARPGIGAVLNSTASLAQKQPDLEVPTLASLVAKLSRPGTGDGAS